MVTFGMDAQLCEELAINTAWGQNKRNVLVAQVRSMKIGGTGTRSSNQKNLQYFVFYWRPITGHFIL
jgi:hypothetical protein